MSPSALDHHSRLHTNTSRCYQRQRHIGSSIETRKKILALVQYLLFKAASLQCQNEKIKNKKTITLDYEHKKDYVKAAKWIILNKCFSLPPHFFPTEFVAMDSGIAPLEHSNKHYQNPKDCPHTKWIITVDLCFHSECSWLICSSFRS